LGKRQNGKVGVAPLGSWSSRKVE